MSQFIRVRIQDISSKYVHLALPDGSTIAWPRNAKGALDVEHLSAGDELTLSLTHSVDLLNELLNNHSSLSDDNSKEKTKE
jgi:hypothetical protein